MLFGGYRVGFRDVDDLYVWRMDPDSRMSFRGSDPVPYATHLALVDRYFESANSDRWFVVEVGGEPVGTLALYDFSADGTEAEWGRFVIAPAHRRRGWGRRSLALLLRYAGAIGVRELCCEVLAGNAAAAGLYRRLGFTETGSYESAGRRFLRLRARLTAET